MGKTNVPLLMGDVQTDNAIFGRTNNPWNLGRTPGGSSGGAAAALAAGLTPLETRSDIAGSIRIPAHFCGLYGLKPSERRVSSAGHIPDLPGSPRTVRMMATSGPLARSIEGLYLAFRLIAGADLHDSEVPPLPIQDFPEVHLNELRISFATSFPGVPVANDIHQAIVRFVNDLSGGAALVDERLPRVDFEAQWQARDELRRSSSVFVDEGPPLTVAEYFRMLDLRDSFIRTWELFFSDWGVLICPVAPCTAFPHCPIETQLKVDEVTIDYWQVLSYCTPFSYTGHPAVVLPIGQDRDGLPIGVQVVARRWNDERLLAIAQVMAEITDGVQHPEL